ncbi:MAG: AlbA family DNA-binding domain-containing protein, partial [Candidatus Heimdallarchaeota archaeon]
STFRFNKKLQKVLPVLEKNIVKTITGFMNTNGGILLIGVNNDGKIVGLDGDYRSFGKGKQDSDGFRLRLNQLYESNAIEAHVISLVETFIEKVNAKEFCIITVMPSSEPVFLKKKQGLYVRMDNSTKLLSPNDAVNYSLKHFKK